ncbi:hypothetical protein LX32DRAFT_152487 [Colletotrichum zoysiae]|uniref:Uncharacterized protein n=1 Tax=Colletotrichum zoysiae TaxID=1216348 RepID=A0AAD9HWG4_9PEZI|nr:hypothetical protein LX32DRAFT_152487 [Colletotrichum zoysiae]
MIGKVPWRLFSQNMQKNRRQVVVKHAGRVFIDAVAVDSRVWSRVAHPVRLREQTDRRADEQTMRNEAAKDAEPIGDGRGGCEIGKKGPSSR